MATPANGRGRSWRAKNQKVETLCPECGENVYRNSSFRGKPRFWHRPTQKLPCEWSGTDAIGSELLAQEGVPKESSQALRSQIIKNRGGKAVYVITSAQNATPVKGDAWRSLLNYCKVNHAQLLVIPFRYHNPTAIWSKTAQSYDWWTSEVLPYLVNQRVDINKNLTLLCDIMTQPTATRPLEGFETITGAKSGIIGHPHLELTTVATPTEKLPKILTTTGCITQRNYIPSKAGKKGEFHHTYGALVVEVDGDKFFIRQLNMTRDGSFCDLNYEYDGDEVIKHERIPGLVMGDTHVEVMDPEVAAATFTNADSIVKVLKPEQVVWHDVFDGTSVNHHDRGRVFHEYVKRVTNRRNAEAEVNRTLEAIDRLSAEYLAPTKNIIVASNHNDFLREWVENTDPRKDPENCMFWAETFLAVLQSRDTRWTPGGVAVADAFAYWGKKRLKTAAQTTFLRRDQSYTIAGIECGFHGDRGPGGKPGTLEAFSKIGVKTATGHGHGPGIQDGAYRGGTSSILGLTYAAGSPSGWMHCHVPIYSNGKRALYMIMGGEWRIRRNGNGNGGK